MKQMIMSMRQETVEEYLKRGGTITKIPEVLDTLGSWWGYQATVSSRIPKGRHPTSSVMEVCTTR